MVRIKVQRLTKKNPFSYNLITYVVVLRMLWSSRSFVFYKRVTMQCCRIYRKTTVWDSIFNKIRLATLTKKDSVQVFYCKFLKFLRTLLSLMHFAQKWSQFDFRIWRKVPWKVWRWYLHIPVNGQFTYIMRP